VASTLRVVTRSGDDGPFDLEAVLREMHAFAVLLVEGLVLETMRLGDHVGLRPLGPGDLLGRPGDSRSELLGPPEFRVGGGVVYAALDDRVLALAQRYPRLIEGLQMSTGDQEQRLLAQSMIGRLPRIEDRVQAMMWLLAETWGRVTPAGTVLPIRLTHETLGQLVGARRSTVTLALGGLEQRGALLRRPNDWLLLERPPSVTSASAAVAPSPALVAEQSTEWSRPGPVPVSPGPLDELAVLRARREVTMAESRTTVAMASATLRRSRSLMQNVALRRSGRNGFHHQNDPGDLPVALGGPDR
jgi:CRP/FNR family transcriptional regulator, cyclic AMP receptor protein